MLQKIPVIALLALALAGCNQSSQPAVTATPDGNSSNAPKRAVTESLKPEAKVQNGAYTLTVNPGHVFRCEGKDRAISKIDWVSTDPATKTIEIQVQAPNSADKKTFAVGGATGSANTGNWVIEGVKIFMLDNASKKELASYEVTGAPCN